MGRLHQKSLERAAASRAIIIRNNLNMCSKPSTDRQKKARAYWRKENWPEQDILFFQVVYKKCVCGDSWLVSLPGMDRWQEADLQVWGEVTA